MQPLLDVKHLSKQFCVKGQGFYAVREVSFSLYSGEILGIGGESGCGKSTLGKLLMSLIEPTSGEIFFDGQELGKQTSQKWRRHIQMIFQHPAASLNPRMTVKELVAEPLIIHDLVPKLSRINYVKELLTQVDLSEEHLSRRPSELSGGQKQRVAIARALAANPRLLICDEPFSALDAHLQMQILALLTHLHQERNLSYIVISHDLSVLHRFTHKLAIMYLGKIVEWGPSSQVYNHPLHPYSQALISAVLTPDPIKERKRSRVVLKGEIPSPMRLPPGCPFVSRCPRAQQMCQTIPPSLREVKNGHFAACHFVD